MKDRSSPHVLLNDYPPAMIYDHKWTRINRWMRLEVLVYLPIPDRPHVSRMRWFRAKLIPKSQHCMEDK